jgi:hypothetical protein
VSDQDHTTVEAQSPADVARAYRALARTKSTLSRAESRAYRAAVRAMRRDEGRERGWIARWLEITPGAVDRLLRTSVREEAAA